jgi:hypothetical protein
MQRIRIRGVVLTALLAMACLGLSSCPAGNSKSGSKSKAAGYASLVQRRCSSARGPQAPAELWSYKPKLGIEALVLNPAGGALAWESNQREYNIQLEATAQVAPLNELVSIDSAGQDAWRMALPREGTLLLGDQYQFSEMSAAGAYLYCAAMRYAEIALNNKISPAPAGRVSLFKIEAGKGVVGSAELSGAYPLAPPVIAGPGCALFTGSMIEAFKDEPKEARIARAQQERDSKHTTLHYYDAKLSPAWQLKESYDASEVWPRELLQRKERNLVAAEDGTLYMVSHAKRLIALGQDGKEKWRYEGAQQLDATALLRSDGSIVVVEHSQPPPDRTLPPGDPKLQQQLEAFISGPRYIICLAASGKELWRTASHSAIGMGLASGADNGVVYIDSILEAEPGPTELRARLLRPEIVKLDQDGKEVFRHDSGRAVPASGPSALGLLYLDAEGRVYWANHKKLLILDTAGARSAELDLPGDASFSQRPSGMALGADGRLYFWQPDGLYCLGDK